MVLKVEKLPKVVTIVALIAVNHWKELEETTQIILPIILPFIFLIEGNFFSLLPKQAKRLDIEIG